jgi:hypothetical protein
MSYKSELSPHRIGRLDLLELFSEPKKFFRKVLKFKIIRAAEAYQRLIL